MRSRSPKQGGLENYRKPRANFEEDVALVVRVFRQQRDGQLFVEAVDVGLAADSISSRAISFISGSASILRRGDRLAVWNRFLDSALPAQDRWCPSTARESGSCR